MREKKIALKLWNFIFVALGDTNDGRNIPSASALKFQDFQEMSWEHLKSKNHTKRFQSQFL